MEKINGKVKLEGSTLEMAFNLKKGTQAEFNEDTGSFYIFLRLILFQGQTLYIISNCRKYHLT